MRQFNQPGVKEYNAGEQQLSNHQRLKDREMQRAFDQGVEVPFLPTQSRARRAGTTQHQIVAKYKADLAKRTAAAA